MNTQIKVLVVDDSAFMRKSISIMLESDPEIKVIAAAKDGEEGVALTKRLMPDIVTMDIEMPKLDGLSALKQIMEQCPTSVIMISSLTNEGADATIKALEYGAVDFIPKELSYINVNIIKIKEDLINKVKTIHRQSSLKNRLFRLRSLKDNQHKPLVEEKFNGGFNRTGFHAIGIGISTGGPLSLQKVIPKINKNLGVPVFIVQHMPPKFTASLAARLNSISEVSVKEAEHDELVKPGWVYIAPGGYHMTVKKSSMGYAIDISESPVNTLHKPAVDIMLGSLTEVYGKYTLGIIMTGMGKDGLEAVKLLKNAGGAAIAQDEDSCVVYGMPKAIVDANLADAIYPLDRIYEVINKAVK